LEENVNPTGLLWNELFAYRFEGKENIAARTDWDTTSVQVGIDVKLFCRPTACSVVVLGRLKDIFDKQLSADVFDRWNPQLPIRTVSVM
jgi:hypothetical protein